MTSKNLSAQQILDVALDAPNKIFTAENLNDEFKYLRGKWHPDRNADPKASDVFHHLVALHDNAEKLLSESAWPGDGVLRWRANDSSFEFKYQWTYALDIGRVYVGRKHVLYKFDTSFRPFMAKSVHTIKALKYANTDMQHQFAPLFPLDARTWEAEGLMLIPKTQDVFPLRAVFDHYKGQIPARHVAWIVNRLHNIAAYFEYSGLSHQAICIDNLFISPEFHSVLPLGGWWYATPIGRRVAEVPAALLAIYPSELKRTKEAMLQTDQACIKALGLELLGDPSATGTRLLNRVGDEPDQIPEPLLAGLRSPAHTSAYKGYANWAETLNKAYGKRKFVVMDVAENDIY